ncbi:MAG: hypothetical protein ACXVSE_17805 [Solirubrobacteraceae bacterium]
MSGSGAVRAALGAILLVRPAGMLRLTGTQPDSAVVALTRLLGGRYLAQGALDLAVPHDRHIDATVELIHAVSMLSLARSRRQHARPALLSAGIALALGVGDLERPRARFAQRTTDPDQDGET